MKRQSHTSRLREIRNFLQLTQDELARGLNVPRSTIENIERGKSSLTPAMLRNLSYYAGIKAEGVEADLPLEDLAGNPYTMEKFRRWRNAKIRPVDAVKLRAAVFKGVRARLRSLRNIELTQKMPNVEYIRTLLEIIGVADRAVVKGTPFPVDARLVQLIDEVISTT